MAIISWGPSKYGIQTIINPEVFPSFSGPVALDVEDDEKGGFVGVGMYAGGDKVYYWTKPPQRIPEQLVLHAGNTDIHKLKKWGYPVKPEYSVFDTQIAAYALNSTLPSYALKELVKPMGIEYPTYKEMVCYRKGQDRTIEWLASYLQNQWQGDMDREEIGDSRKSNVTLADLPTDLQAAYNGMDCIATWKLYVYYKPLMPEFFYSLEMPLSYVLFRMEERGVRLDRPKLGTLLTQFKAKIEDLEARLTKAFGPINFNSPKQLLAALHAKGIRPVLKRKDSTDKNALAAFSHRHEVQLLLERSKMTTLCESFLEPYLAFEDSMVHPWFNQCRTRTGRLACKNPNLQQIPIKTEEGAQVRSLFLPPTESLFFVGDYGQIEPRLMAHFSHDDNLLNMFNAGVDFHTFTAKNRGVDRSKAKVLNLSVGYRATYFSVAQQLGCSQFEAQEEINGWWSLFPGLYKWEDEILTRTREDGYVTTLMGRKIYITGLNDPFRWRREAAERDTINNLVQGSAAEVMKAALVKLDAAGARLCVSVHDEAVGELGPKDNMVFFQDVMEHAVDLDCPLVVDMHDGINWHDAKNKD